MSFEILALHVSVDNVIAINSIMKDILEHGYPTSNVKADFQDPSWGIANVSFCPFRDDINKDVVNIFAKYYVESNTMMIGYNRIMDWETAKPLLYSAISHEYLHYLEFKSNVTVTKALRKLEDIDDAMKSLKIMEALYQNVEPTIEEQDALIKLQKSLPKLWKTYYAHTLEKISHAGQMIFELTYKDLATSNNPTHIQYVCAKLLLDPSLRAKLKSTEVWQTVSDARVPKDYLGRYFKILETEVKRLLRSISMPDLKRPSTTAPKRVLAYLNTKD